MSGRNRRLMMWTGTMRQYKASMDAYAQKNNKYCTYYVYKTKVLGIWVWATRKLDEETVFALDLTFSETYKTRPPKEKDLYANLPSGPIPEKFYSVVAEALSNTIFADSVTASVENELWLRHDIDDCTPKEQWDEYCEVSEELKKLGLKIDDPTVEHDCISGVLHILDEKG